METCGVRHGMRELCHYDHHPGVLLDTVRTISYDHAELRIASNQQANYYVRWPLWVCIEVVLHCMSVLCSSRQWACRSWSVCVLWSYRFEEFYLAITFWNWAKKVSVRQRHCTLVPDSEEIRYWCCADFAVMLRRLCSDTVGSSMPFRVLPVSVLCVRIILLKQVWKLFITLRN